MLGSNDFIHQFSNNNNNTINFDAPGTNPMTDPGANFDTLTGSNSSGNFVEFTSTAQHDVVDLERVSNDFVVINQSGLADCDIFASNIGSAGSPVTLTSLTVGTTGC
jgi:hypothetical protein